MLTFIFPNIDPVILQIYGPIALRWYNLSYIVGLMGGLFYCRHLVQNFPMLRLTKEQIDKFLSWAIFAIILGGRLGEIFFYPQDYFLKDGWQVFRIWEGGMSFHGASLGLFLAFYLFSKKEKVSIYSLGDCVTAAAPIGLFFGRIANFINDELYGRVTNISWSVAFPSGGYLPRHPSQLYEAFLEGLMLFTLLVVAIYKFNALKRPGIISGFFSLGYGLSRFFIEFFREPDGLVHVLNITLTMGQFLSLPMIIGGLYLLFRRQI